MAKARRWPAGAAAAVEISEDDGVRLLHIGGDAIQSAIRLASPEALELDYTRAMMAFLLFHPQPAHIAMVGLGGGSIARFVHRRMAASRITVVEIRADVVEAARRFFGLPADDERLAVVADDGAAWVPRHPGCADVLLLDAFEDGKQVPTLCREAFYAAARAALRPGGILVANFIADDRKLDTWLERIARSFGGRMVKVGAADRVNIVALAFRDGPARVAWRELKARARALEACHALPFARLVASLKALNAHTMHHLLVASG